MKKALFKIPWHSSGDEDVLDSSSALRRLTQHSRSRSVECTQHRKGVVRGKCTCLATLEGAASITISHSMDARRYSVMRSEALSDRRCS